MDELLSIGVVSCLLYLLESSPTLSVEDVLSNRGIEEDRLLRDETDLLAVVFEVEVFDVDLVEEYFSLLNVIETLQQFDAGALP